MAPWGRDGIYGGADRPTDTRCFCRPTAPDRGSSALRADGPKPIYIGGYGAVFSLQVDFPLLPPPETAEPNKTADKTDRIWAAAQRELSGPAGRPSSATGRIARADPIAPKRSRISAAR